MSQSNDESVKAAETILRLFSDGLGIRHIEAVLLDYGQGKYDAGYEAGLETGYEVGHEEGLEVGYEAGGNPQ